MARDRAGGRGCRHVKWVPAVKVVLTVSSSLDGEGIACWELNLVRKELVKGPEEWR